MQDKPSQLNVPAAASLTSCLIGGRSMWNCQTYDGLSVCQHWFPLRLNMVICCKYNNLELSAVKTVEVIVDYYQRLQTSSLYIAAQLTVKSFHFLGTTICQNLNQELKISFLIKNAQQKMHYKRQGLRKAAACYQFCQKRWLATICLLYRAIHHQDAEMGQSLCLFKFIPPHDTDQCKKLEGQVATVWVTFQFRALV